MFLSKKKDSTLLIRSFESFLKPGLLTKNLSSIKSRTQKPTRSIDLSILYTSQMQDPKLENSIRKSSFSGRVSFYKDTPDILRSATNSRRLVTLPYQGKDDSPTDCIGCNRSIESINARAEVRSKTHALVSETRKREDAEQIEIIQKCMLYKQERHERKAALKETEERRKFWTKLVVIINSQSHVIQSLPMMMKEYEMQKIRAVAARTIRRLFVRVRERKLYCMSVVHAKDFWKLVKLIDATVSTSYHILFSTPFSTLQSQHRNAHVTSYALVVFIDFQIPQWRKKVAIKRLKNFLICCAKCSIHGVRHGVKYGALHHALNMHW